MNIALLPCPFCAAGETQTRDNTHWTGMRNQLLSVEIQHWCDEGQNPGVRGSHVTMRGKTFEEAATRWNRRSTNSLPVMGEQQ